MRTIKRAAALAVAAMVCFCTVCGLAQVGSSLPSTSFTRGLLKAPDAATARTALGLASTNQTTLTNVITVIPPGTVAPEMLTGGVTNAWQLDATNAVAARNVRAQVYDVRDYGARAGCLGLTNVVTTIGSTTLNCASAAFTSADVGKNIEVVNGVSAGVNLATTIDAWVSATQITLHDAAGAAVTNQAYYGHDDTSSFQAAHDAALLVDGGTVYVPPGIYLIDGPFVDQGGGSGTSAMVQIVTPLLSTTQRHKTVRWQGSISPFTGGLFFDRAGMISTNGSILVSARTPANATDYTIVGAPVRQTTTWGFSQYRFEVDKITFRIHRNSKLTPLSLRWMNQASVTDVNVDVGVPGGMIDSAPAYANYGVVFPSVNNGMQNIGRNILVQGCDRGIRLGECGTFDMLVGINCGTSFEAPAGFHAIRVGYTYSIASRTNLVLTAESPAANVFINVQAMDSELDATTAGDWGHLQSDLLDPLNLGIGEIHQIATTADAASGTHGFHNRIGASKLTLFPAFKGWIQNDGTFSFGSLVDALDSLQCLFLGYPRGVAGNYALGVNLDAANGVKVGATLLNSPGDEISLWGHAATKMALVSPSGIVSYGANTYGGPTNGTGPGDKTTIVGWVTYTNTTSGGLLYQPLYK